MPVANILIDAYLMEPSYLFSDEHGEWSLWLAPGTVRDVSAIPTLCDFAATGSNEVRVTAVAGSGEQQVRPLYVRVVLVGARYGH